MNLNPILKPILKLILNLKIKLSNIKLIKILSDEFFGIETCQRCLSRHLDQA